MFDKTANIYDTIYTAMKDFPAEAAAVDAMIQQACPGASTLLDVACGTGLHDETLKGRYQITGLDLDESMLAIARGRNPEVDYVAADMTTFDLDRRFDAVICLFSSIGYTRTLDRLSAAIERMAAHLNPGGVLIIEPWLGPDEWIPGRVHASFVDTDDLKIARMDCSAPAHDGLSTVQLHYMVGTPDGVRHLEETHVLGLFTADQHVKAIQAAGLVARHEADGGWAGRGVLIGNKPGASAPR